MNLYDVSLTFGHKSRFKLRDFHCLLIRTAIRRFDFYIESLSLSLEIGACYATPAAPVIGSAVASSLDLLL